MFVDEKNRSHQITISMGGIQSAAEGVAQDAWGGIKGAANDVWDTVTGTVNDARSVVQTVGRDAQSVVETVGKDAQSLAEGVGQRVGRVADTSIDTFQGLSGLIQNPLFILAAGAVAIIVLTKL